LLLDYRGYGGNPGRPSEQGLTADADAAAAWLSDRPGIDDVVYFGESLGAAVAIAVATDRPPAALVLRSPFTSLVEVARVHYGPVPRWLLRDRYPAVDQVASLEVPVLVVAGERDTIVPLAHSRRLFEAAPEPKRFVSVPDAGHNDPVLLDGTDLLDAVTGFLRDLDLLPPG
ncbi:MAG: alpha/beta hydrolase, partial [Nitriliruptorales bacterium]